MNSELTIKKSNTNLDGKDSPIIFAQHANDKTYEANQETFLRKAGSDCM